MCLEAHRLYVETFGSIGSSWVDWIALRRSDRSGSIGSFCVDRIVLVRSDRPGSIGFFGAIVVRFKGLDVIWSRGSHAHGMGL